MKVLHLVEPFVKWVPEIKPPTKPQGIRDRLLVTALSLFTFLVCCQIPIFGGMHTTSSDPLYWMRVILASNKGTLMEFGISPIVTISMLLEILAGLHVIEVNREDPRERALYHAMQKIGAIGIALAQSIAYVGFGMYGSPSMIGPVGCIGIVIQLLAATVMCQLFDEVLERGWGISNAISLFITTNICETIIWKSISPSTFNTGRGTEFEGAIVAFFHLMLTRSDKARALTEALYRPQLPNLMNLVSTAIVFAVVIYLQGFKVELATMYKGQRARPFPIRLFYTSSMPIILQTTLISNLNFISQLLYRRFPNNIFVTLMGRWEPREFTGSGQLYPVSGLTHWITPPESFGDLLENPAQGLCYIVFVMLTCAIFSLMWTEITGLTSHNIARKHLSMGVHLRNVRPTEADMALALNKYIPTAAAFGGMCVGIITICANFLGAIGSGTGVLIAVTMINSLVEVLQQYGQDLGVSWINAKRKIG